MRLDRLLGEMPYRVMRGTEKTEVRGLRYDSRQILPGEAFVCIRGALTDGHRYLTEAVSRGASAVLLQEDELWACRRMRLLEREGLAVLGVLDTRCALAQMAAVWYGRPAARLKVIGITGTKGKTTTAYLIRAGLQEAGFRTGLIGTVETDTCRRRFSCVNTTPESLEIQAFLREMADAGCSYAVMEVSSQALKQHRTDGILFHAGVFTNLGRDHIGPGEHADMEEYLRCKRRLFTQCELAVGNGDDAHLGEIWQDTSCRKVVCRVETKGGVDGGAEDLRQGKLKADYRAEDIRLTRTAAGFGSRSRLSGGLEGELTLSMPGGFNVSNALEAAAVLRETGVSGEIILRALGSVQVPGRMEAVEGPADCRILVDYAHNAMSLEESLRTLKGYMEPDGRLVVIFGCGGNRSPERRASMGETAGRLADLTIITTDNPRYEDPRAIMSEIRRGVERAGGACEEICDRAEAIRTAIEQRKPGDVILIAGKGHETYQEIRGERFPMDDRELVRRCTRMLS